MIHIPIDERTSRILWPTFLKETLGGIAVDYEAELVIVMGYPKDQQPWLKEGDEVTIEVSQLGREAL